MLEITIKGPPKSGKTWAALIVAEALKRVGANVNMEDQDLDPSDGLKRMDQLQRGARFPEMDVQIVTTRTKR